MKRAILFRLALLGAAGAALSGCGGGGGGSSSTTPPPPTVSRLEDNFGTQFGTDYRAPANSQPVTPASGDIIPLSLTTQPVPLH